MSNLPKKKKRIALFVTGGTITCDYDSESDRIMPAKNGEQLVSSIPWASKVCDIKLIDFCSLPSPQLTPALGVELAARVQAELDSPDIDGAVVVQGTDTLEEMAYLLHLLIVSEKPVVFTGSMKSDHELYRDAPGNLCGALMVASSDLARGYGVLVYFDQEIHSARYVTKSNSNNISAFKSIQSGPIGLLNGENLVLFFQPLATKKYPVPKLEKNVQLIKAFCGMDDLLVRSCIESGVDGLVIEGMGAGNLPICMMEAVQAAIQKNIPVVITTRCPTGVAIGTYAYPGGGAMLEEIGAIIGGELSGPKARIRLMVLLEINNNVRFLRDNFLE